MLSYRTDGAKPSTVDDATYEGPEDEAGYQSIDSVYERPSSDPSLPVFYTTYASTLGDSPTENAPNTDNDGGEMDNVGYQNITHVGVRPSSAGPRGPGRAFPPDRIVLPPQFALNHLA